MDRVVEAGIDCIEHGEFLDEDGIARFNADTANRIIEAGTYVSPTLAAYGWDTILRLRVRREADPLSSADATALQDAEDTIKGRLDTVNRMLDLGMADHIVASTDAGCFDYSFGHMDYNLELLVEAGMSPMQAIQSATRFSAKACGVDGLVGTLEPGKYADILLVQGDPTQDIGAISNVRAVFKAGALVHEDAETA